MSQRSISMCQCLKLFASIANAIVIINSNFVDVIKCKKINLLLSHINLLNIHSRWFIWGPKKILLVLSVSMACVAWFRAEFCCCFYLIYVLLWVLIGKELFFCCLWSISCCCLCQRKFSLIESKRSNKEWISILE